MKTKLVRVGNSRGIRIPQGLLKSYAIEEGDALELEETREGILIRSSEERPRKPPSRLSGPLGTRSAGTVWMIDRYGIYWVDLDSVEGRSSQRKDRRSLSATSHASEIAVDQIRTISRRRLGERVGSITETEAASLRHVIAQMYGVLSVSTG